MMSEQQRKARLLIRGLAPSPSLEHIFNMANWLIESGWHVEILAPDYHGIDLPYTLDEQVRLTMIGTQQQGSLRRRIAYFFFAIWTVCRGADVVVATSWSMAYLGLAGRILGPRTKLVHLVQSYEPDTHVRSEPRRRQPVQGVIYRLSVFSYRLPLRKITTSEALKAQTHTQAAVIPADSVDVRERYVAYFDGLL